jgi:hypothetical protein
MWLVRVRLYGCSQRSLLLLPAWSSSCLLLLLVAGLLANEFTVAEPAFCRLWRRATHFLLPVLMQHAMQHAQHRSCMPVLLRDQTSDKCDRSGPTSTVLFPCSETSNFFLLRFSLGPAVLEWGRLNVQIFDFIVGFSPFTPHSNSN